MRAATAKSYAESFDMIDQKLAAGQMTPGDATVGRLRLTAEIHELTRPLWQRIIIVLISLSIVVGAVVLIVRIVTAASGF